MEDVENLTTNVSGWLTNREGVLLYNLAKQCKNNHAVVEIGSWMGKSTIWLSKGVKTGNNARVYAIDPHTGSKKLKIKCTLPMLKSNLKKACVEDVVEIIVKTSQEAAENFDLAVGVLFIDGSHIYDMVKLDFDLWYPKVVDGGIIAFHDATCYEGVQKLVHEVLYKSKNFRKIRIVDSIVFGQKVGCNTFGEEVKNLIALIFKRVNERFLLNRNQKFAKLFLVITNCLCL